MHHPGGGVTPDKCVNNKRLWSYEIAPPGRDRLWMHRHRAVAVVKKPRRELGGIGDPVLITPALVLVNEREGKAGAVTVTGQTNIVVYPV